MAELIGIDLGATAFKFGRVTTTEVHESFKTPVHPSYSSERLIEILTHGIAQLIGPEVKAIGIGVPGVVDPERGIIYDIQNLPEWKQVPLGKRLSDLFKIPVFLNNDANCFAKGLLEFGGGKAFKNFVGLSIGTGLGMGVIINHQLYNGTLCGAGEIGMLPYKDGILEDYVGSFFFKNKHNITAVKLHELAQKNDPKAIEIFKEFGTHLGEALKIICYTYAPQAIFLGGSIAQAFPFFNETAQASLSSFAYPQQISELHIATASINNLPILGAASLCLNP